MRLSKLQFFAAALLMLFAGVASADTQRVLVIGAVHDDPKKLYGDLQPIARYMQQALAPDGIESVEILIVPDRNQMVRLLRDNRIDWVSETAFGAMYLKQRAGAELLSRKWKDGAATYRALFFARKDANISSLSDLLERTVAFEHKNSTSAFFVPATMMIAKDLPMQGLATPRETPSVGSYGYVYSGHEYNTTVWVHKGIVDAGVVSDTDWQNDDIMPSAYYDDFVVFESSDEFPRAIEVVRAGLSPVLKQRMREILHSMHTDSEADNALAAYNNTTRFDDLTTADLRALEQIGESLPAFSESFP